MFLSFDSRVFVFDPSCLVLLNLTCPYLTDCAGHKLCTKLVSVTSTPFYMSLHCDAEGHAKEVISMMIQIYGAWEAKKIFQIERLLEGVKRSVLSSSSSTTSSSSESSINSVDEKERKVREGIDEKIIQNEKKRRDHYVGDATSESCTHLEAENRVDGGDLGLDASSNMLGMTDENRQLLDEVYRYSLQNVPQCVLERIKGIWDWPAGAAEVKNLEKPAFQNGRSRSSNDPVVLPLFVDVGAQIGQFTVQAAMMGYPVLAFEPFLSNRLRLQ